MPTVPDNLPSLLLSRPQRIIIEGKQNEYITLARTHGRPLAYLVTKCEDCTFDFRQVDRLSQILFEDCENLVVNLCPVIGSADVIKCEMIEVHCSGSTGTVCIDMSTNVRLFHDLDRPSGFLYTSSSSHIAIELGSGTYEVPAALAKNNARSKSWQQNGIWQTAMTNMYGDTDETG